MGYVLYHHKEERLLDMRQMANGHKQKISELFIENFSYVIILQQLVILAYIISLLINLTNKIKPVSHSLREKVYNIIDTFEYSFLILLFATVAPATLGYIVINFKYASFKNVSFRLSMVVSIYYLAVFVFLVLVFVIIYASQKGLKYYSNFKSKISFLFVGYKESSLANIYEVIQLILTVLLCIVLTGLFQNVGAQTNFLLFLQIL